MTAYALEDERRHCLASGMNDHVAKPIDPAVLLTVLFRWLAPCGHEEVPPQAAVSNPEFPATLTGINLTAVLARLTGNRKLLLRLLRNFRREWSGTPEILRAALTAGNLEQVRLTAHTLRGVAANLAVTGVAAAADALDQALKQKKRDEIERCVEALATALTPVLAGLEQLPPVLPVPAATAPMDRRLLGQHLSELALLLRQNDLKAEDSFAELQAHLEAGEWSEVMERLDKQIDKLDYAAARITLAELATILGM